MSNGNSTYLRYLLSCIVPLTPQRLPCLFLANGYVLARPAFSPFFPSQLHNWDSDYIDEPWNIGETVEDGLARGT